MRTYSTLIVGLIAGSASGKMNDTKMKVKIRKQKATIRKLRAKLKAKNVELKGCKNADVGIDEEVSASLINESPEEACVRRGGHTGNLAVLSAFGGSCDNIAHGHDPTALSCENADGSDNLFNLAPGVDFDLKALCPEKCGVPCGHAPTVDINAIGANWGLDPDDPTNCAALRDGGLCETEMLPNWFCGESCRGGGPYDECMFHKSAREQIDEDCAASNGSGYGYAYGYGTAGDCVAEYVATWLASPGYTCTEDTSGTWVDVDCWACPGDTSGADCYFDTDLSAYGSTQVKQCESSSMVGGAGAL